jgi:hypothetical protein
VPSVAEPTRLAVQSAAPTAVAAEAFRPSPAEPVRAAVQQPQILGAANNVAASTFQTTNIFRDFDAQFGGAVFFNNQVSQ